MPSAVGGGVNDCLQIFRQQCQQDEILALNLHANHWDFHVLYFIYSVQYPRSHYMFMTWLFVSGGGVKGMFR